MRSDYRDWLEAQQYEQGTVTAQIHRVGRVEDCYGSLDDHYSNESLQNVIDELNYTAKDQRSNVPNPSKLPIVGDIRNNLASYKNAVVRYRKFLTGWERSDAEAPRILPIAPASLSQEASEIEEPDRQKFSLERDMQAMLRRSILSLGATLKIIDDGAERSVDSGFIDILCEDIVDNSIIVIELKAGKADGKAIGQILGYMGDLALEEDAKSIKGILVAHDFDKRARAAARVVPSLKLMKYAVTFQFEQVD